MSKFITFDEACGLLGIGDFEIFEYLKKGLQIYSKYGNPEPCPGKFHRYFILQRKQNSILKPSEINKYLPDDPVHGNNILPDCTIEDEEEAKSKALKTIPEKLRGEFLKIENEMSKIIKDDPTLTSWKHFDKEPYSDGDIEDLISELKDNFFKKSDVEEHLESSIQDELKENGKIKVISFYKSGDIWWIGKKGNELSFKPLKGFEYIQFLIRNIDEEFNPIEVYFLGDVPLEIKEQIFEQPQKLKGLKKGDYEKVLQQLKEKLDNELNPEKRFDIKEKIKKIEEYQNSGIYSFGKGSDKCRISVYNSIKKAVEKIHEKFKERGDNDIINLFNVGKSEIIKSGRKFCYEKKFVPLDIKWQFDPE